MDVLLDGAGEGLGDGGIEFSGIPRDVKQVAWAAGENMVVEVGNGLLGFGAGINEEVAGFGGGGGEEGVGDGGDAAGDFGGEIGRGDQE